LKTCNKKIATEEVGKKNVNDMGGEKERVVIVAGLECIGKSRRGCRRQEKGEGGRGEKERKERNGRKEKELTGATRDEKKTKKNCGVEKMKRKGENRDRRERAAKEEVVKDVK